MLLTTRLSMVAWGYNADGELGDGTTISSDTPVIAKLPPGLFAIAISAGPEAESSLAIIRPR